MSSLLSIPSPIDFLFHAEAWDKHLDFFKSYTRCIVLSDEKIDLLHGRTFIQWLQKGGVSVESLLVPSGESAKTIAVAASCWERLAHLGVDRHALLICLGGGAITDLGGYVAACYMRGIDVVH